MIVSRMQPGHISGVKALLDRCFGEAAWSVEMITDEMDKAEAACAVMLDSHRVVGYLAFEQIYDEASVVELAVDPSYRRQGIARYLLELMLSAAQGVASVVLEVRASNAAAIALYRSLGFEQVATREDYYTAPREDAVIMKKTVIPDEDTVH